MSLDDSNASQSIHRALAGAGDTKSIVLALQSLQEKIRKLESDRNYHQEQCDAARSAHEQYKREVESQLEKERAEHRRREYELQSLITRATEERTSLQRTLEDSRKDLSAFRSELEGQLDRVHSESSHREVELQEELARYRRELTTEKRNAEQLAASMDQLRKENELIETTNRRLEATVQDLIAMNNKLIHRAEGRRRGVGGGVHTPTAAAAAAVHHVAKASPRQQPPPQRHAAHNHSANASAATLQSSSIASRRGMGGGSTPHYRDPTHCSMLRCERYDRHEDAYQQRVVSPARGGTVRSATPPPPPPKQQLPSSAAPPQRRAASAHRRPPPANTASPQQLEALDSVAAELEAEHGRLQRQYQEVIQRASAQSGDPSSEYAAPEVLTATLNSIMVKLDRKAEQLRLLRLTRADLVSGAATSIGSGGQQRASNRPRVPIVQRGFTKATQKASLMNELRALLARSSES